MCSCTSDSQQWGGCAGLRGTLGGKFRTVEIRQSIKFCLRCNKVYQVALVFLPAPALSPERVALVAAPAQDLQTGFAGDRKSVV